MTTRHSIFLVLALLLITTAAQSAHITDRLVAGLYSKPDVTGEPIRALTSGTPVDILKRTKGYSRVRLGDDSEGWVENRYISTEKPARVMLLELQAKNSDLHKQLKKIRNQQVESADNLSEEIKQNLATSDAEQQRLEQQLEAALLRGDEAEARIESLQQRLQTAEGSSEEGILSGVTPSHFIALFFLVILLSFIGGMFFKRHRISKRYGGFRI